jgi:hypothetical protein
MERCLFVFDMILFDILINDAWMEYGFQRQGHIEGIIQIPHFRYDKCVTIMHMYIAHCTLHNEYIFVNTSCKLSYRLATPCCA